MEKLYYFLGSCLLWILMLATSTTAKSCCDNLCLGIVLLLLAVIENAL